MVLYLPIGDGESPSGKARDSDSRMREFKSYLPSQYKLEPALQVFFIKILDIITLLWSIYNK